MSVAESDSIVRVYKFLEEKWALESIREHRIKISEIHDLNDPYELLAYDLSDADRRRALLRARDQINKRGVLCFSRRWSSPLLWAHYADKHRGICLGFDVPRSPEHLIEVDYVEARLPFPERLDEQVALQWLRTKFVDWKYEDEVRVFASRDQHEGGNYFASFDKNGVTLREVITGHRCPIERGAPWFQSASLSGRLQRNATPHVDACARAWDAALSRPRDLRVEHPSRARVRRAPSAADFTVPDRCQLLASRRFLSRGNGVLCWRSGTWRVARPAGRRLAAHRGVPSRLFIRASRTVG